MRGSELAIAIALGACGMAKPWRDPILPELEPPTPTYNSRVVALRTTLGRAAIRLEVRGTTEVVRGSACDDAPADRIQVGCVRCELAGEHEPLDSAVLDGLKTAFDRYPAAVLEATHIDKVALCRSLSYEDLPDRRTVGTVDLRERRLLLSIAPFLHREYDGRGDLTTEDIVHHELFHLAEYERMRDAYVDDPEWRLQNVVGFTYREPDSEDRQTGFVNAYASTHETEDRASVYQYLMARPDELCALGAEDDVVRAKTRIIWSRIAALTSDAFLRARASCAAPWIEAEETRAATHRLSEGLLKRVAGSEQWLTPPPLPARR